MLLTTLKQDLTNALKKGERERVETLRFLIAAINNAAIAKYGRDAEKKLIESDVLEVLKKQVKTHKESIEAFQKGGRTDLVTKEQVQLEILQTYLPAELSDTELKQLLEPVVASGEKNFGLLMKQAMGVVGGRADGGRVAGILKQMISQ